MEKQIQMLTQHYLMIQIRKSHVCHLLMIMDYIEEEKL